MSRLTDPAALARSRAGRRLAAPIAVLGVSALLLTGCGGAGSDSAGAPAPSSTAAASPNGQGGQDAPGEGRNGFGQQFQAIRECLTAAGLPVPTFNRPSGMARPSGMTGRPTAWPSGMRPSGRPSGMGGGMGRDNPFSKLLSSPQAQEALKACGITLPTGRPSGAPGGPDDQDGPAPTS